MCKLTWKLLKGNQEFPFQFKIFLYMEAYVIFYTGADVEFSLHLEKENIKIVEQAPEAT